MIDVICIQILNSVLIVNWERKKLYVHEYQKVLEIINFIIKFG